MSLQDKIKDFTKETIIWLKGESREKHHQPLYTKEELKDLYSIKKDLEKFPKRSED